MWSFMKRKLSALLLCLLLLLCGRPISLETYPLYVRAAQLQRAALTVYICTGFTASFLEEHALKE